VLAFGAFAVIVDGRVGGSTNVLQYKRTTVQMYYSTGVLVVIMRIIINKLNIKNARQIGGQLLLVKAVEFAAMDCTWAGAIAVSSVRQITAILSAAVIT